MEARPYCRVQLGSAGKRDGSADANRCVFSKAAKPEQVPLDVLGGEQSGQDDWLETIWLKMIGSRRRARRDFSRRALIS